MLKLSKRKSQIKPLPKVIIIVGPTASGKTSLGIKLAKKISAIGGPASGWQGAEIISADSRQIYRGLNIGTAKPTLKERGAIPHHLIDVRYPNQPYSVAQYKRDCLRAIRQIVKKNKLPIIVGGTGLYIKTVVHNLSIPQVRADPLLRKELEQEFQSRGLNFLYGELIKLDPEAAYIIDPRNPRRVIRALEIILSTKKTFSESRRQGKPLFNFLQIGINRPSEKLKERINKRIDVMIATGLIEEVKNLIKKYPVRTAAFEAIGYREIISYLQKETSLEEAVELMKKNSWQFAKRQMTWFRKEKRIHWITAPHQAERLIKKFLA
ncbi:MAG: tRNA (adenosine(37)-N6)-dimethylallyltransferase MiaA [Candidatus Colwellbacteria bacterium]|nr:tRNA (adenosine(37)-N6)-dimethylallyltransferase MiaA [Candidatus Colwellbacteria bacterium]